LPPPQAGVSLFLRQVLWFENYDEFLERARECKGHLFRVILHHWGSHVRADIESFSKREANGDHLRNPSLRDLLSVHKQDAGRAFADAAFAVSRSEGAINAG
jgi:hypothetical protein